MMNNQKNKQKHTAVFLKGKKVMLRALQEEDINERYLSWLHDQEVTKYMETGIFPTTLKELRNFYNKVAKSRTDLMFAIIDKKNNLHIGNIKLGSINWVHRFADLGIMIGDKKYWGSGYGQDACKLLLAYAFERLNLNKVILGVYVIHKSAIRVYQKVGFKIEGKIRNLFNIGGRLIDKIIMGISQKEFKKINDNL